MTTRHKGQVLLMCEAGLIRYLAVGRPRFGKIGGRRDGMRSLSAHFAPVQKAPARAYAGRRGLNRSRPGKGPGNG